MTDREQDYLKRARAYYDANAETFFLETSGLDVTPVMDRFTKLLAPGARVLDAGCGSGRDSLAMARQGFAVDAFDVSPRMAALAREHTGLPVACMSFQDLEADQTYQGIWTMGALHHLPHSGLGGVLARLARALVPGGVLYASFKHGNGESEKDGLIYAACDEKALGKALPSSPVLKVVDMWLTPDARPWRAGRYWLNALLAREVHEKHDPVG